LPVRENDKNVVLRMEEDKVQRSFLLHENTSSLYKIESVCYI
jgi:hypothetical protein